MNQVSETSNECKEKREIVYQAQSDFDDCMEQLEQAQEQKRACYEMDRNAPEFQPCLDEGQIAVEKAQQCNRDQNVVRSNAMADLDNCLTQLSQDFSNLAFNSVDNQIYALQPIPNTFCLPLPKEQAYDFNVAESYENPIRPLRSGRGCGGVRARVAETSNNTLLTSGKPWSEMIPTLVE